MHSSYYIWKKSVTKLKDCHHFLFASTIQHWTMCLSFSEKQVYSLHIRKWSKILITWLVKLSGPSEWNVFISCFQHQTPVPINFIATVAILFTRRHDSFFLQWLKPYLFMVPFLILPELQLLSSLPPLLKCKLSITLWGWIVPWNSKHSKATPSRSKWLWPLKVP